VELYLHSSSGTELGYGLEDLWFQSRQGLRVFLFTTVF
jgi:hypothetical protein